MKMSALRVLQSNCNAWCWCLRRFRIFGCIGFRVDLPNLGAGACGLSSGFKEARRVTAVQFCKTVTLAAKNVAGKLQNHKLKELFASDNSDYVRSQRKIAKMFAPDVVISHWMKETWATEICSAVVSKSEKLSEGIKQLRKRQRPDENMEVLPKSRAWYLLEGDQNHQPGLGSLVVALKKVCHDECADLVKKLADKETQRALSPYDAHNTLEERCAELVVREVEAETLGCCAKTCGWNGRTCGLWDYMNPADQQDWQLECCAEGAILNGSFASQPFELS